MTPLRNKMNNVLASRGNLKGSNVGNRAKLINNINFASEVL